MTEREAMTLEVARGRAKYLRDIGEVKSPQIIESLVAIIESQRLSRAAEPECAVCGGPNTYDPESGVCRECQDVDKHDARLSRAAEPVATTAENKLAEAGVFKGQHGLRGLLEASAFWEKQPYGTRMYYGDGIADYLHRGVLDAAVKLLDTQPPEPARDAKDAARFHWLLENCSTNGGLGVDIFIGDEAPDAEDLIERIDAAMAQESGDE